MAFYKQYIVIEGITQLQAERFITALRLQFCNCTMIAREQQTAPRQKRIVVLALDKYIGSSIFDPVEIVPGTYFLKGFRKLDTLMRYVKVTKSGAFFSQTWNVIFKQLEPLILADARDTKLARLGILN